ncbi:hypothetical protein BJ878DRAFT_534781 [Calycina marina]|uniref:Uncharacterized protein n=1 Tax=Calycina marina TaxID=1763456 RepID=A0A9P7Z2U9_9HELO|nr:hypothetical protein BJ878DRAFT_534781 [Calycina marina]
MDQPTSGTPKRKREVAPPTPPASSPNMRINTSITGAVLTTPQDDSGSPRTKVAYGFQGLRLDDGGAISRLDLRKSNTPKLLPRMDSSQEESAVRKRVRVLGGQAQGTIETRREVPETPEVKKGFSVVIAQERIVDPILYEKAAGVILHNEVDSLIPVFKNEAICQIKKASGLGRAYPSENCLADSKSRAPMARMNTYPLFGAADASDGVREDTTNDEEPLVIERAAQTWHDDEITGHRPTDPDDDGEGINGIGFKPTPAIAYARTEKRKAQLAEYRNREAREARAKRSERRRGCEMSKSGSKEEEETARRVRFMESGANSYISNK